MAATGMRRGWSGPPLVVQILALLVGALLVAQVVTLALTLLLPPQPPPRYEMADIAAALRGEAVTSARPLERRLQAGPPDLGGRGWMISDSGRGALARLLHVPGDRVTLGFYVGLPLDGGPPGPAPGPRGLPADARPAAAFVPSTRIDLAAIVPILLLQEAPPPPPPAAPPSGGGGPGAGPPNGPRGAAPGFPGGFPGRFPGRAGLLGTGQQRPAALPQAPVRPVQPGGFVGADRPGEQAQALGREPLQPLQPLRGGSVGAIAPLGGTPASGALRPIAPGGFAASAAPAGPLKPVEHLIRPVAPDAVATYAPQQPFRGTVRTPATTLPATAAPALPAIRPADVRPAAIAHPPARQGSASPAVTVVRTAQGLFGASPAPFVEGDFLAGTRLADGRWAVVSPRAEGFPTAWQRRLLLWFALSLVIVTPLAWLFARRLVQPLRGFAAAADALGRDPAATILPLEGPAEIGRAAHAFNQMQSRLRSFVDDRSATIGAISHDLRTPLTRLRFRLEELPDEERDPLLGEVIEMEAMIASVIAYMRDAGTPNSRERLDLSVLIDELVEDAALVGGDVSKVRAEAAPVDIDVLGIRRVLDNLLTNALKYGYRARIALRIDQMSAIAEIVDDGPGIPVGEIDRVFEPFYRSPDARASDHEGSGLGLAVCRSIARAHGGDVSLFRSREGFVARMTLPLAYEAGALAA